MVRTSESLHFPDRRQWRAWLAAHHDSATEAWVIHYKARYSHLGLTLDEAVEEALCFGWIDSTLYSIDEKRYALRYSPRKRESIWSINNIQRVEKLIAEGKMTAAGQRVIDEAIANGQWEAAVRREQVDLVPRELEEALNEHELALDMYHALPDSRKKRYIYWLQSAKRDDTKQKRAQKIVEELLNK